MGRPSEITGLRDLPSVLGEKMPEIEFNEVGRLRLMKALQNRFGQGFRNIPGVRSALSEFDEEVRLNKVTRRR